MKQAFHNQAPKQKIIASMECPVELQKADWMACQWMSKGEVEGSLIGKSDGLSDGLKVGCFKHGAQNPKRLIGLLVQRITKGSLLGKLDGLSEGLGRND
jgi:hypothetical protein